MKRRKIARSKFRKVFKKNSKFHKRNLPMALRGGRRLPL